MKETRQIRTDQDAIEYLTENHSAIEIVMGPRSNQPCTSEDRSCCRCGGSGVYRYVSMGMPVAGVCFLCGGRDTTKRVLSPVIKRARQLRNNETARLRREKKRVGRVAAKSASADALFESRNLPRFEAFVSEVFPNEETAKAAREGRERSALQILQDLDSKAQAWGDISEKQIDLYRKLMEKVRESAANPERKVAVPEGRHEITGTIISIVWSDGEWGLSCRMTVKVETEEGIWIGNGTLPRKVFSQFEGDTETLVGRGISLTATMERSDRDESFGFLKRPSKAMLVAEEVVDA